MLRKLFFISLALVSACSIVTDLDGLSGGPLPANASNEGGDAAVIDAAADGGSGPVCTPGQSFSADPKNCGACGHDCLGGQCFQGACQPILLASVRSDHIRLDATHAYFADSDRDVVSRVAKAGGPEQVLATQQDALYELDVDDGHVYFMNLYGIRRVPKTGGGVQNVTPTNEVRNLLVAGQELFWSGWAKASDPSSVYRLGLDGSNELPVVENKLGIETMVREGDLLFYGENGQNDSSGAVHEYNLVTKEDRLVTKQKCRRMVVDATDIYFLDFLTPTLWKVPRAGGDAVAFASSTVPVFAADIVADDRYIYWTVNNVGGPGGVLRIAKDAKGGGPITTITTTTEGAGVAVDSAAIYWSHKDKPGVYLLAKPLD